MVFMNGEIPLNSSIFIAIGLLLMSKIILDSHITGDRGVAAFHAYCANHYPFILWRSETVNDFGIDGEVELTSKNANGKLEATGEILKVQIKSTSKGSYIHKEDDDSFEFRPRQEDVEYWNKHKLDVVLVIFDDRTNKLYCKKILKIDEGYFRKNIPITIGKKENILSIGENKFLEKFSYIFKQRINHDIHEKLSTNIFKFTNLPKFIYQFEAKIDNAKEIFNKFESTKRPIFLFQSKKIHTFFNPNAFPGFRDEVIEYSSKKELIVRELLKDKDSRRLVAELMNLEFKQLCYNEKISFNKQYGRYFFLIKGKTFNSRVEYYDSKSGKRKDTHRTVVAFKEYKTRNFYRHFAFETKFIVNDEGFFMVINPQYLFTNNGFNPLEDKSEITKLTNYLTSKERNQQVLNHVHFIFSFLANGKQKLIMSAIEGSEIELSSYQFFNVDFGIPIDNKKSGKVASHHDGSTQQNMF
jgi:hypothetical protein